MPKGLPSNGGTSSKTSYVQPNTTSSPGTDISFTPHIQSVQIAYVDWITPNLHDQIQQAKAIDMPGFGSSPGTRLGSRSELNNVKGGPLDIACAVLDALGWGFEMP